jgi:hypothetical protein|tara:strand:- start:1278 stop:3710 length:2433 start_codon:yes stop_codon:yes gene_type:complete
MQISYNTNSSFPSQVVPDAEKATLEYGLAVGRAIEGEWFRNYRGGAGGSGYAINYNNYHNLRLYARGEQPVQKYKDELAINGDLSYLNIDWKPVPVISKFVDIVVNGMSEKSYELKAFAVDPFSIQKRTKYARDLMRDVQEKELAEQINQTLGITITSPQFRELGLESDEEVKLHLQLDYKQSVEIAEEELLEDVLNRNKYELTRRKIAQDLTILGIGAVKTNWSKEKGIIIDYVDPATLIYSYTEDPNFEDIYYVGEVKSINLADLKTQFPYLSDEEMEQIQKYPGNSEYLRNWSGRNDEQTVQVIYFEYKTYSDQVFKVKKTATGLEKALEKPDTFSPPENENFEVVSRTIETLYSGAKILGHPMMLKWELAENMTRPFADTTRVKMNYNICAPRIYKGRIESIVSRITGFADMIQLTHLKIQQVLARVVPDGVFLDMDGLAEVDLGNGTNYNPAEALNMYFQTGSIVGRSLTQDGDPNRGKVPIQELQTGSGGNKIGTLIQTYQYYLQMIRDVTGLNEARDGSTPDKDTLVGLQKLAANASNTATRHLQQAMSYLTIRTAENVSLRISDSLEFPFTKQALENSISRYNLATLAEISDLNLHDFGIFIELEPDEEQQAQLEQNIQIALKSGGIDLEDAIDLREIKNIKLANQMLKERRRRKQERDQRNQQANIQAQAEANAKASEASALAELQKQQGIAETTVNVERAKSQMDISEMQQKAEIDKQLMELKFGYDMQLKQMDLQEIATREKFIEDRKDKRTKLEGTQQSEMISQRANNSASIDFEDPFNSLVNSTQGVTPSVGGEQPM